MSHFYTLEMPQTFQCRSHGNIVILTMLVSVTSCVGDVVINTLLFAPERYRPAWWRGCGGSSPWSWYPHTRLTWPLSWPWREWTRPLRAPRISPNRPRLSMERWRVVPLLRFSGWVHSSRCQIARIICKRCIVACWHQEFCLFICLFTQKYLQFEIFKTITK